MKSRTKLPMRNMPTASATQKAWKWTQTFALVTSLTMSHIPATSFAAGEFATESQARTEASDDNLASQVDSPKLSAIADTFERYISGPIQKKLDESFNQEIEITDSSGIKVKVKQWQVDLNKAKIEIPLELPLIHVKGIEANVIFKRRVVPTEDGRQLRSDSFEFEIGNTDVFRGHARIKLIASKYFSLKDAPTEDDRKNLKLYALKSKLNTKIPRSAADVMQLMQAGEIISIEIDGGYGIGYGKGKTDSKTRAQFGIGLERGATVIFDLKKNSPDQAQVRLMGLKNKGSVSLNAEASLSLLPKAISFLKNIFSVGISLNANIADKVFNRYPIESMLIGYDFNLKKSDAQGGLQNVFTAFDSFGFLKVFDPTKSDESLSRQLIETLGDAERLALDGDRLSAANNPDFSVRHNIRAKMVNQAFEAKLDFKATNPVRAGNSRGGSKTYIRYHDLKTTEVVPYIVWSDFYQSGDQVNLGVLSTHEYSNKQSLDFFFESSQSKEPTKLLMMVNHFEGEYGSRDAGQMGFLKNKVKNFAPEAAEKVDALVASVPSSAQNGVKVELESIINPKGLAYLGDASRYPNMQQALLDFFLSSSKPNNMEIRQLSNVGDISAPYTPADLAGQIVTNFQKIASGQEIQYTGRFVGNLTQHEMVSRWIAPEFIARQLPNDPEQVKTMFGMTLKFSSAETAQKTVKVGATANSEIYTLVNRLKKILSDRDFDVRISEDLKQ